MSSFLKGFKAYLQLERSYSNATVEAYLRDTNCFFRFLETFNNNYRIEDVTTGIIQDFLQNIHELELSATTQARMLSGIKAFFKYLLLEGIIQKDPTDLIDAPKQKRSLPAVLSIAEIDELIAAIDRSKPEGQRNVTMLEVMYSCGLRVSELISLKISDLFLDAGFIRVIGKGNKQRLVPIGEEAAKLIKIYSENVRNHMTIADGQEDMLFVNRRGAALSRVMVFMIIKEAAANAGITVNVHPHTFRHSFATHLVEAGADLRAVQQMLGHKSITTTEIYTHLDNTYLRDTLSKFHPRYM